MCVFVGVVVAKVEVIVDVVAAVVVAVVAELEVAGSERRSALRRNAKSFAA